MMNLKNNKGFTLSEVMLAVIMFSLLILSIFSILQSLVLTINDEAVTKKINNYKTSINTDLGRFIKDSSYELAFYKYSDFLSSDNSYYNFTIDHNKNITTENVFRNQIKTILNADGISLVGGKIIGIIDEKSQKQDSGGTVDLSEREGDLNKLKNYGICNGTVNIGGFIVCDIKNNENEINDNFGILVAKKGGLVHLFYVKDGLLKHKVYNIEQNRSNNNLIEEVPVFEKYGGGDIKLRKFKVANITQNYTYYDGGSEYSNPSLQIYACNIEYNNNNIIVGNLQCK